MANEPKEPELTERAKHLHWCKTRAFEYLDKGDIMLAWASFASDMSKNKETEDHMALNPFMAQLYIGSVREMRNFIEGFN